MQKLELNTYLTKLMICLAQYPLLLEAVLKQMPKKSSNKQEISKFVTLVCEFFAEVNLQRAHAENRFLLQLEQQLLF